MLVVMIVNADNTCDQCALDALQHFSWQRKTLTTLNSTHNLFDQAQRAQKQMYDKQHGKAKGTVSGQASARTIQHNMTAKT